MKKEFPGTDPVNREAGKNETAGNEPAENVSMIHRINTVYDEISSLYHKASEKLGMADSEMLILYLICEYEETLTQSDIMNITGMSKQTINSAVSRMENSGWLVRSERSGHRRSLQLTDEGSRVVRSTILPFRSLEENIFSGWSEEDRKECLRLSEMYRDALRSVLEKLPDRKSR